MASKCGAANEDWRSGTRSSVSGGRLVDVANKKEGVESLLGRLQARAGVKLSPDDVYGMTFPRRSRRCKLRC